MSPINLNVRNNTTWAAAEVIISGLSLFLLYKFVVSNVGVAGLGLWSLVLATTSLARFGDIGTAAGVSRFVAIAHARGNASQAALYVETAFIASLALYTFAGLLLAWPLYLGLAWVVPTDRLGEARVLLPYAILSFALLNLSAALLSALIGIQRSDLKSKVVIGSLIVQIAVVASLVGPFGLMAMAWGQIAQYIFTLVAARWIFRRLVPTGGGGALPTRFDKDTFRELLSFGLKLQASSLISFAFEPLTKFAISATAGLAALGLFEMAYRMVLQVRHVIVAPLQTLLPTFAHLDQIDQIGTLNLYNKSLANTIIASTFLLGALFLLSPIASLIWISRVDPLFCFYVSLCCVGWFFNTITAPAYIIGTSRGYLKGNIAGHIVMSFIGPISGFYIATITGINWLAVGLSMFGLICGGILSATMNCSFFNYPILPAWRELKYSYYTTFSQILRLAKYIF